MSELFNNLTYDTYIQEIINTRGQWNIPKDQYFEKHHILPVCLGGSGDKVRKNGRSYFVKYSTHPNCIWLYPKEHFIAHYLLVENIKIIWPQYLL